MLSKAHLKLIVFKSIANCLKVFESSVCTIGLICQSEKSKTKSKK